MNFSQVIMAHIAWKKRLEKYLNGDRTETLNPDVICRDNQWVLGKWIYGEGSTFQHYEEFPRVREEHAMFHKLAAQVVQQCDAGDIHGTKRLLETDYSRISERVKRGIARLARRIENR